MELGICKSLVYNDSGKYQLILKQIYQEYTDRFEKRFKGSEPRVKLYVSLDGTDCSIEEQTPFSREWYSHKLNGPGLRYEIGLNIASGDIVWAYGGYPCGSYPDLKLERMLFMQSARVRRR